MPHTSGLPVPLGRCPEVIEAQQRHVRLRWPSTGGTAGQPPVRPRPEGPNPLNRDEYILHVLKRV
ncbi:hypothetical protein [Streptomyces sp. NPDC001020]